MLTLMKMYNEREQDEQGKLQNENLEEKKKTPRNGIELNSMFKEIN